MSLRHFFLENQIIENSINESSNGVFELDLSSEDAHHAKVLRLIEGEHIGVVDADGVFYECEIVQTSNKITVRNCLKKDTKDDEFKLWLFAGLPKANKLDDVIRAACEIGIDGFAAVEFDRSVTKIDSGKIDSKLERWKKIAKSASMQSGQYHLPKIDKAYKFDQMCEKLNAFDHIFVCWEQSSDTKGILMECEDLRSKNTELKIAIVVGPEGGICSEEIEKIQNSNKNTSVVSIGDSILRTETADVVSLAIVKFLLTC